jgi:hypothetical protein
VTCGRAARRQCGGRGGGGHAHEVTEETKHAAIVEARARAGCAMSSGSNEDDNTNDVQSMRSFEVRACAAYRNREGSSEWSAVRPGQIVTTRGGSSLRNCHNGKKVCRFEQNRISVTISLHNRPLEISMKIRGHLSRRQQRQPACDCSRRQNAASPAQMQRHLLNPSFLINNIGVYLAPTASTFHLLSQVMSSTPPPLSLPTLQPPPPHLLKCIRQFSSAHAVAPNKLLAACIVAVSRGYDACCVCRSCSTQILNSKPQIFAATSGTCLLSLRLLLEKKVRLPIDHHCDSVSIIPRKASTWR